MISGENARVDPALSAGFSAVRRAFPGAYRRRFGAKVDLLYPLLTLASSLESGVTAR